MEDKPNKTRINAFYAFLILSAIPVFVGVVVSYRLWGSSQLTEVIIDTGIAFQVTGLLTIISGIWKLQEVFDQDREWEKFHKAFLGVVHKVAGKLRKKERVYHKVSDLTHKQKISEASGESIPPLNNIKDRVSQLEKKYNALDGKIEKFRKEIKSESKTRRDELKTIDDSINDLNKELEQKMEEAHLGDMHWQKAGVVCLILGLFCTVRPEWVTSVLSVFPS